MDVRTLIISGSMGAGKTTVLCEASDLLTAARVAHAAIDLDALGAVYVEGAAASDLAMRNLASVWNVYAAAGVRHALLAGAIEDAAELRRIRAAVPSGDLQICRLVAPTAVMERRVAQRDTGIHRDRYVARVTVLESILNASALEHFRVTNDGRTVTDVAREVLGRAGWMSVSD
jgi:hypothetical protein